MALHGLLRYMLHDSSVMSPHRIIELFAKKYVDCKHTTFSIMIPLS